ncbi:MAG: arsenate reductase family protein [Candidatus Zixiibacteriota bacterium]
MAPKRAQYLTYGNDELCAETRKFIENAGVLLDVRDIGKNPLSEEELTRLIGHLEITHFLNTLSESYTKYRLDKNLPSREQIIKLIARDHTLLRRPIVRSSRLLTIGCDKQKIADMLQIKSDGESPEDVVAENHTAAKKAQQKSAAASK